MSESGEKQLGNDIDAGKEDEAIGSEKTSGDIVKNNAESGNNVGDKNKSAKKMVIKINIDSSKESYVTNQESNNPVKANEEAVDTKEASDTTKDGGNTETNKADPSCYRYEGEVCVYTDPETKSEYVWDKEKNNWTPKIGQEADNTDYKYDGTTYTHTDKEGVKHRWNIEKNEWEKMEEEEESEEDDNTTEEEKKKRRYRKRLAAPGWDKRSSNYSKDPVSGATTYKDENDGVVYEWDVDKKAWFPKMDEDFMAMYQLSYGFTKDGVPQPTVPDPEEESKKDLVVVPAKKKAKTAESEAKWFEEDETTVRKVYVSGLPTDITEEKFNDFMAKCGMIEYDIRTKKPKLKIYKDENGAPKGDGLCSYMKHESVQLAMTILDGSDFDGCTVKVEPAKFQMKGEAYDPKLKPRKLKKKEIERAKMQREKMFAWVPDKMRGERSKHDRVIVIKNLFDPKEFDQDAGLIIDYSNKIREKCSKFGSVGKVMLHDKHEDGVCQVWFKEPEEADMAIEMMNKRMFGSKVMEVATWDGKTKYKKAVEVKQDEEERNLDSWDKFLNEEDNK